MPYVDKNELLTHNFFFEKYSFLDNSHKLKDLNCLFRIYK